LEAAPAFSGGGGGVCCFEHLSSSDSDDGSVSLTLLCGEPGLHLAQGVHDLNPLLQ
jgi:hypothetical protein